MISLPIVNKDGQQVGTYEFDPAELAPGINKQLMHDATVMYETNRRVGTVRTKARGEVVGSTKKIYKQKGTGRARMGQKRTGIRRGGGHIHAIRPIDYVFRMPKKAVALATRMALLSKFQDNQVVILDDLVMLKPRTKDVVALLKAVGISETSVLVATAQHDAIVYKSARNIPSVQVLPASDINTYVLLRQRRLMLTRAAMDGLRDKAKRTRSAVDA